MSSNPSPSARFSLIIMGLLRSLGARMQVNMLTGGYPACGMAPLAAPLAALIGARLQRAARLFAALAERVRLGKIRIVARGAAARPSTPGRRATGRAVGGGVRLPRRFGGVMALLHWEAVDHVNTLTALLAEPDMSALVSAAPGFARILRPLCRMLGVVPPPGLLPPPPERPGRSAEPAAATTPAARRARHDRPTLRTEAHAAGRPPPREAGRRLSAKKRA